MMKFPPEMECRRHFCPATPGFSLIELLVVIAIIAIMAGLAVPAFNAIKGGGEVTKAAYDLVATLETARAYAIANNTYVWVGFFEEDVSKPSTLPIATVGTGRLVLSTVASKDGTCINNHDAVTGTSNFIDGASLIQVGKLVKMENAHLALVAPGSGTGDTLDTRPAVEDKNGRYGEINAGTTGRPGTDTKFPFLYPLTTGTNAAGAQYIFKKTLRFSPRGEATVNSTYSLRTVVEIGLQPTHGTVPDTASQNVTVVQFTGVAGNAKIYRR